MATCSLCSALVAGLLVLLVGSVDADIPMEEKNFEFPAACERISHAPLVYKGIHHESEKQPPSLAEAEGELTRTLLASHVKMMRMYTTLRWRNTTYAPGECPGWKDYLPARQIPGQDISLAFVYGKPDRFTETFLVIRAPLVYYTMGVIAHWVSWRASRSQTLILEVKQDADSEACWAGSNAHQRNAFLLQMVNNTLTRLLRRGDPEAKYLNGSFYVREPDTDTTGHVYPFLYGNVHKYSFCNNTFLNRSWDSVLWQQNYTVCNVFSPLPEEPVRNVTIAIYVVIACIHFFVAWKTLSVMCGRASGVPGLEQGITQYLPVVLPNVNRKRFQFTFHQRRLKQSSSETRCPCSCFSSREPDSCLPSPEASTNPTRNTNRRRHLTLTQIPSEDQEQRPLPAIRRFYMKDDAYPAQLKISSLILFGPSGDRQHVTRFGSCFPVRILAHLWMFIVVVVALSVVIFLLFINAWAYFNVFGQYMDTLSFEYGLGCSHLKNNSITIAVLTSAFLFLILKFDMGQRLLRWLVKKMKDICCCGFSLRMFGAVCTRECKVWMEIIPILVAKFLTFVALVLVMVPVLANTIQVLIYTFITLLMYDTAWLLAGMAIAKVLLFDVLHLGSFNENLMPLVAMCKRAVDEAGRQLARKRLEQQVLLVPCPYNTTARPISAQNPTRLGGVPGSPCSSQATTPTVGDLASLEAVSRSAGLELLNDRREQTAEELPDAKDQGNPYSPDEDVFLTGLDQAATRAFLLLWAKSKVKLSSNYFTRQRDAEEGASKNEIAALEHLWDDKDLDDDRKYAKIHTLLVWGIVHNFMRQIPRTGLTLSATMFTLVAVQYYLVYANRFVDWHQLTTFVVPAAIAAYSLWQELVTRRRSGLEQQLIEEAKQLLLHIALSRDDLDLHNGAVYVNAPKQEVCCLKSDFACLAPHSDDRNHPEMKELRQRLIVPCLCGHHDDEEADTGRHWTEIDSYTYDDVSFDSMDESAPGNVFTSLSAFHNYRTN